MRQVAFGYRVLHRELKVRESFDEAGKKPGPCLGVQRGGLEAHGGIGDVISVRTSASAASSRSLKTSIHRRETALLRSTEVAPLGWVGWSVVASGVNSLVTLLPLP